MSSKKSKRTRICPGCKISAEFHSFGPLGKHCEGLYPREDEDNATPVTPAISQQDEILKAIRALSEQVGSLKLEHDALKEQLAIPGPDPAIKPKGNAPYFDTNHSYVDLYKLLEDTQTTSDRDSRNKDKSSDTIESFDHWLEAWSIYEFSVVKDDPSRYGELARYRSIIQHANRKFRWSAVYDYDVRFRKSLSTGQLDIVDTTLYSTLLDSSSVRKESLHCQRCGSQHHLVRDCSFRPKSSVEANQATKKSSGGQTADQTDRRTTWKFEKWFDNNKEGCNLYQRRACQQGSNCKRAHVCKACRGNHAMADCTLSGINN